MHNPKATTELKPTCYVRTVALAGLCAAAVQPLSLVGQSNAVRPADAGFELTGTFTCETFHDGAAVRRSARLFRVCVGRDKWQIRTMYKDVTNEVKFFETSFDGVNLYTLVSFDTNRTRAHQTSAKQILADPAGRTNQSPQPKNDSYGTVRTGLIPDFDVSLIQFVWLPYCSGKYFSSLPDRHVPPMFSIGAVAGGNFRFLTTQISWLPGDARLPNRITFWNEGEEVTFAPRSSATNQLQDALKSFSVQPVLRRAPWPYSEGFTNAVYEVIEVQAVGRSSIPTHFKLSLFRPKPGGQTSADVELATVVEGKAEIVNGSVAKIGPPEVSARTLIVDKRVNVGRESGGVVYWANGERWLSQRQAIVASGPKRRHLSSVRLLVTLVLLGVPAGVLYWVSMSRRSRTFCRRTRQLGEHSTNYRTEDKTDANDD